MNGSGGNSSGNRSNSGLRKNLNKNGKNNKKKNSNKCRCPNELKKFKNSTMYLSASAGNGNNVPELSLIINESIIDASGENSKNTSDNTNNNDCTWAVSEKFSFIQRN